LPTPAAASASLHAPAAPSASAGSALGAAPARAAAAPQEAHAGGASRATLQQLLPHALLGRTVWRPFLDDDAGAGGVADDEGGRYKWYEGKVLECRRRASHAHDDNSDAALLFLVHYPDGDAEDLSFEEVMRATARPEAQQAQLAQQRAADAATALTTGAAGAQGRLQQAQMPAQQAPAQSTPGALPGAAGAATSEARRDMECDGVQGAVVGAHQVRARRPGRVAGQA
jgi:hypothetical protein